MSKKKVDTLVTDIQDTLSNIISGKEVEIKEEYLEQFKTNVSASILRQLTPRTSSRKDKVLYFSEIGKPCSRALWYEHHDIPKEPLSPEHLIKFIFGDILEELLILLIKVSGHTVTDEQKSVTIPLHNGWELRGRIDFKVDGTLIDAKSASSYSFKKFDEGSLLFEDPFGYMAQLAGYALTETSIGDPGFLAIDKQHGKLALFRPSVKDLNNAKPDAQMLVHIVESEEPPSRAYLDKPYGRSGNHCLDMECSFCSFKQECWKDSNGGSGLRSFKYADGRVIHLTNITKEPRIQEI